MLLFPGPAEYHVESVEHRQRRKTMARVCQVSGKKGNHAKHIRHRHSGPWKFRAPKRNRIQGVNLQKVTIKTKSGKVRLVVAASILKSEKFAMVVAGLKPIPKEWLKKPTYNL